MCNIFTLDFGAQKMNNGLKRFFSTHGWLPWLPAILLLLTAAAFAAGASRGIQRLPVQRPDGTIAQIKLYSGYHALVIGCSAYRNGWEPLANPVQDAREVAAALRGIGFETVVVENPDAAALRAALNGLMDGPGKDPEHAIMVYFAGHGHTLTRFDGTKLGYLVPVDAPAPAANQAQFMSTAVSMREIEDLCTLLRAKHVLMAFDCCFSGAIFRTKGVDAVPPHIRESVTKPVRAFITAGTENEPVPDESLFKTCLVQGLAERYADLNHDGFVSGQELGLYLKTTVVDYASGAQHPQYGKINHPRLDKGDFIFHLASPARKPDPPPTPRPSATPRSTPKPNKPTTGARDRRTLCVDDVCFDMVHLPADTFTMGSPPHESGRAAAEGPAHTVRLSAFWMGATEVTQGLWQAVMGANPSHFERCGADCPVEQVSWDACQQFIQALNRRITAFEFSLPSEAQWEYACRAGAAGAFAGGGCISTDTANFNGRKPYPQCSGGPFLRKTVSVKSYAPNAWGLYDLHGNVWEWCQDSYVAGAYDRPAPTDPIVSGNSRRVFRGGGWLGAAADCRCAARNGERPAAAYATLGLRLAGRLPQ